MSYNLQRITNLKDSISKAMNTKLNLNFCLSPKYGSNRPDCYESHKVSHHHPKVYSKYQIDNPKHVEKRPENSDGRI